MRNNHKVSRKPRKGQTVTIHKLDSELEYFLYPSGNEVVNMTKKNVMISKNKILTAAKSYNHVNSEIRGKICIPN